MAIPAAPGLSVRRDGARDFEVLDPKYLGTRYLNVGSGMIGKKVKVDCRYLWEDSQWGVFGTRRQPAGILYMDISITQPEGYWLSHASVYITMSEMDDAYALQRPHGEATDSGDRGRCIVSMTGHYGPQLLMGPESNQKRDRSFKLFPELQAAGVQVGGIGYEQSKSQEFSGRWVFKGNIARPQDHYGYKTMRWDFHENHLDYKRCSGHEYHTGFSFAHRLRPVFMRVEVEGKLRSKMPRLKNEWLCFSSSRQSGRNPNASTVTRLTFDPESKYSRALDLAAEGLDVEMQSKNLRRAGVLIPDIRATHQEEQAGLAQASSESTENSAAEEEIVSALYEQLRDGDDAEGGILEQAPSRPPMNEATAETGEANESPETVSGESPSTAPSVMTLVGSDEEKYDKLGHLHEQFERLSKFPGFAVLLKIFCFIVTYLM